MKNIVIALTAILLVIGGIYFLFTSKTSTPNQVNTPVIDTNTPKQDDPPSDRLTRILAGEVSLFTEFRQEDYEKALSENKIIFLDFYANWCPICRAEEPFIHEGFNKLTTDSVAGFRVNFEDSETDENEKKLSKQFNVPIQHTKIILKNGKEFSRSNDTWKREDFDQAINRALGN